MDTLIEKIEETVYCLVRYDMENYAKNAQELADMMMTIFPVIIAKYSDPRMKEYAEEAKYWPAQLERILNAFDAGDDFATMDVLYNETRPNLIELKEILGRKGIN